MSKTILTVLVLLVLQIIVISHSTAAGKGCSCPNFLLVVVDDMGFADLGAFGGEIHTPNLDQLAYGGLRFTDFQAAPACSPTRAMLLTGVDSHIAGHGNLAEEMSPNQKGQAGYEGYLNDRVVSVAEVLRGNGYRTYLSGKWHLGLTPEHGPQNHGFQRSFAMLSGGASHFRDMKPAYSPDPAAVAPYLEDGVLLKQLPENFNYSSQFYVDQLIEYLEKDTEQRSPFFAMLAFTAPHWPLQAPDQAIARYADRYTGGYDRLFTERRERMIKLGLLSADAPAPPRPPKAVPWSSLDKQTQRMQARAMAVYAAMIDQVDVHTGRLVDYLKQTGQFDNTIIIFLSDNGAEGHDLDETWPAEMFPQIRAVIDTRFDHSEANMGRPDSYTLYGAGWARAGSPHLRMYKAFSSEGGVRVAAFVHAPGIIPAGKLLRGTVSVKDVTPTILDFAGLSHPAAAAGATLLAPLQGVSLRKAMQSPDVSPVDLQRSLGVELLGKYGLRYGQWKLLHLPPPYGSGGPELYDLSVDPGESRDLAQRNPAVLKEMLDRWETYRLENGVILPDWVSGY